MLNFADRLISRFIETKSILCAGIDPDLNSLPRIIKEDAHRNTRSDDDFIYKVLCESFIPSLEVLCGEVAACKPNIAFFEQYGIAGLRAFQEISAAAKRLKIPVIVDAKRGDIGSTAQAYASAYLGRMDPGCGAVAAFEADALTVNPYLGADTLEIFVAACERYGKGLFVLVRTSNPGSAWLQSAGQGDQSVAIKVANWISERGQSLVGSRGISSLGAVVGATYPDEARRLRAIMKNNLMLIPGFGAQGAAAKDALAGLADLTLSAAASTVNVSRGLFGVFSEDYSSVAEFQNALLARARQLNSELNKELQAETLP